MEGDDKPLPPSAKRLADLRSQGNVPRSMDVNAAILLTTGLAGLLIFGGAMGRKLAEIMAACLSEAGKTAAFKSPYHIFHILGDTELIIMMIIFLSMLAVAAVASQVLQVGIMLTDGPLNPDLEKINPASGIKKLFTLQRTVMAVMALVKLVVIGLFAYAASRELLASDVFIRPVSVQELGGFMLQVLWSVGWRVLLALALIALVDFLYQRWNYAKQNRMSVQDLKEEMKQYEGSPEVKAKQRTMARKFSMRRMLEDMSDATIVVTNPTHYAVALRYQRGKTPAPIMVAKGIRLNALRIKERAIELGVPMMENKPLAQGLFKHGQVGQPIPALYYQAVAILLAQLYKRGYRPVENEQEN